MNRAVFKTASVLMALLLSTGLWLGAAPGSFQLAADETSTEINRINGRYFGKLAIDFGKVITSPLRWKGKDIGLAIASGAGTLLFFAVDHGIRQWVEKHNAANSSDFSLLASKLGEGPFLLGLMTSLYLGGEAFHNDGLRKTAMLSLESYAISGVIVTGLKFIFGRHRPLAGHGPLDFNFFSIKSHEHSFPSGHSVAAFSVASVIAGQSDSAVVGALCYGLASLVALSRVNNNEHWASDVVAGSLLGYFIGKAVLSFHRPSSKDKPTLGFALAPGGVSLALRF